MSLNNLVLHISFGSILVPLIKVKSHKIMVEKLEDILNIHNDNVDHDNI